MPGPIATLDEGSLKTDLRELVGRTVEETPNGLPGEEAEDLVGAERHGRTAERQAYRAGHYDRKPTATSGEAALRMPRPKGARPAAATAGRRRRREAGAGEGHGRDVPGGRLHQARRGRGRDPAGAGRLRVDGVDPEREGVRLRRGVAQPPARARLPVRLR